MSGTTQTAPTKTPYSAEVDAVLGMHPGSEGAKASADDAPPQPEQAPEPAASVAAAADGEPNDAKPAEAAKAPGDDASPMNLMPADDFLKLLGDTIQAEVGKAVAEMRGEMVSEVAKAVGSAFEGVNQRFDETQQGILATMRLGQETVKALGSTPAASPTRPGQAVSTTLAFGAHRGINPAAARMAPPEASKGAFHDHNVYAAAIARGAISDDQASFHIRTGVWPGGSGLTNESVKAAAGAFEATK